MSRLKILQCLVFYLPNRIGGIEVYVHTLNRQLQARGHEVKVMVPDYPLEPKYPADYEGIPIITYPETLNASKAEFSGNVAGRGLAAFKEQLIKEQPDIVHFHQFTSSNGISIFHIRAAKQLGLHVVYTNHLAGLTCQAGTLMYRGKEYCDGVIREIKCSVCALEKYHINEPLLNTTLHVGQLLTKIYPPMVNADGKLFQLLSYTSVIKKKKEKVKSLLQLVDCFIVLTDWFYEVLNKNELPLNNVRIIKQGLPFVNVEEKSPRAYAEHGIIRLVFAGRVYPEKGLLILLDALQGLDESKITLDIYGQVDDKAYEQECKRKCDGKNNIQWRGLLDNKNIMAAFAQYDLLVLPSMIAEMAPLVIREAFAAGIPVIGTNCGGIAEEIGHEYNGFLFEMGDVEGLRKVLHHIIGHPLVIQLAAEKIRSPRSFEQVTTEVESAYFSVLKN